MRPQTPFKHLLSIVFNGHGTGKENSHPNPYLFHLGVLLTSCVYLTIYVFVCLCASVALCAGSSRHLVL